MSSAASLKLWKCAAIGAVLVPLAARAGAIPTTPPVNFTNSTDPKVGSIIVNLLDSYSNLTLFDPKLRNSVGVMERNIQTDNHTNRDHDNHINRESEDFNLDPDDTGGYTYRMTYGLALAASMHLPENVPVQAQVLLLTRFPYATDEQRTKILRDTALPSGFALLDGNTWDGWGRLNLYAAVSGYDAFFRAVRAVTMPSTSDAASPDR